MDSNKLFAREAKFALWMGELDDLVGHKFGCSVHDLPDQPFRDWFDTGLTPSSALEQIEEGV
jgi:hypothetical protein